MTNLELIQRHELDCGPLSIIQQMKRHSTTYDEIIGKGMEIVPDILRYLDREDCGMSIIMLLWGIPEVLPYLPPIRYAGHARRMKEDLVDWAIENKIIWRELERS